MLQDIMKELGITLETPYTTRRRTFNCDCFVSVIKAGKSKQVTFSFYNGTITRIIGNTDYMTYGLNGDKTRIYFVPAKKANGFKVSSDSQTCRGIKRNIQHGEYDKWTGWKGRYYLRYDKRVNCYYIDIAEKINEN